MQIKATPLEVWSVLTDLPSYSQWNPFIVDAKVNSAAAGEEAAHAVHGGELSEGLPHSAEGQSLTLSIQPQSGKSLSTFSPTVLQCCPGTDFRWLGMLWSTWLFGGEHYFCLRSTEGDSDVTTLVQGEKFTGILVPFLRSMVSDAEKGFVRMNEALRQRVEQKYKH